MDPKVKVAKKSSKKAKQEKKAKAPKPAKPTKSPAEMEAKFPKPPRQVQKQFEGMEDKVDAVLSAKLLEYVEARDYRMSIGETESKLKGEILAYMASHGIASYRDAANELEAEAVATDVKLKVKHFDIEKGESSKGLPPAEPATAETNGATPPEAA